MKTLNKQIQTTTKQNDELKENWDPTKTLNMYRDLLHKTWSG